MTKEQAEEVRDRLNDPNNYDGVHNLVERKHDWRVEYTESLPSYSVCNEFELLSSISIKAYLKVAQKTYCGIWATDGEKTKISIH